LKKIAPVIRTDFRASDSASIVVRRQASEITRRLRAVAKKSGRSAKHREATEDKPSAALYNREINR
jgi:hypothetical protein